MLKADAVERGCGERKEGGCYIECGLSNKGFPFPHFYRDSPIPIPHGLDLRNKTTLLERVDAQGNKVTDASGSTIWDAYIWVGEEHYSHFPYFVEEARQHGISRKIPQTLDTSRLTRASCMVFAHRKVILPGWRDLRIPHECEKNSICTTICPCKTGVPYHDLLWWDEQAEHHVLPQNKLALANGPCLSKLWELLPTEGCTSLEITDVDSGEVRTWCTRQFTSATSFTFCPSGEDVKSDGYLPGFGLWTPITGVALVKRADGSVNEKGRAHLEEGVERHGENALPWYEADK